MTERVRTRRSASPRRRIALVLATLAALLASPAVALAADCPQTTLGDVEDEVMCPVCGVPLELATEAPQANAQRALIADLIADCRSKEEVKDELVAQFGRSVLATPDDEGFDLAAYLVPLLALLGAGTAVALAVARWRSRPGGGEEAESAPPSPLDPDDAARLEADLRRSDL